jgi:hydroxylamine dehydrogenase
MTGRWFRWIAALGTVLGFLEYGPGRASGAEGFRERDATAREGSKMLQDRSGAVDVRDYRNEVLNHPSGSGGQNCVGCHEKTNPTMVAAWQQSSHAAKGVGCAACHGDNHSRIFEVKGAVSAAVCGACHAKELKEFDRSLHAVAMDMLKTDPRFDRLSPVMADQSCVACHKIGTKFPDGSRGQCNSCHSGHSFSSAEARRPEACVICHTGPDHPQLEMWQASKHGQLFAAEATRSQAPTCVTCHLPAGTHDTGIGLTLGNVANGAVLEPSNAPVKMRSITLAEAERHRAVMVKSCLPCHSSRLSAESLEKADQVKVEADALLGEAAELMARLQQDGLIGGPSQRAIQPATPDRAVSPGLIPDFEGPTHVEQRYFDMVKFHHATTFKGAYHQSPVHTHNLGFLRLKQDLNFIRTEAARLRKENSRHQP